MLAKGAQFLSLALLTWALVSCGGGPVTVVIPAGPPSGVVTVVVTPGPPSGYITVVVTPEPPSGHVAATATPPPPPAEAGVEIVQATFARDLSEQLEPVDPGADFAPEETVNLSVIVKGRPKAGVLTARCYWHDTLINEAGVDLADVNSGMLFSIGENTLTGYTLSHTEPFPVSDAYRAELFYNEAPLGSAAFRVVPPPEAVPSRITQVVLAKGADENNNPVEPATVFAFDQAVYLVGRGDLGLATWLVAEWWIGGRLDDAGTRDVSASENHQDVGFAFSYVPEGGWPQGEHFVVLFMNDREVGRSTFTVAGSVG